MAFAERGSGDRLQLTDGSMPDCLPVRYLQPGSDLLALRRSATLTTGAGGRALRATQWYLLADELGRGAFLYLDADAGPADLPADGRAVREWRNTIFYVRNYSVNRGDGVPALCAERLQGAAMRSECLVEGVERLQVVFHVDRNGDGRSEVRLENPAAADLRRVTAATIYLHVRTLAPLRVAARARELHLGSERVAIPEDDPFLHRVFVRTVRLANISGGIG